MPDVALIDRTWRTYAQIVQEPDVPFRQADSFAHQLAGFVPLLRMTLDVLSEPGSPWKLDTGLDVAVGALAAAWTPPTVTAAGDDDGDDYGDGCSCGGETDEGDPICNCADNCGCSNCDHLRHLDTARCHLRVPREGQPYAWCGAPTRYRVRPYCVHRGGVIRGASDGDPAAENGDVKLGDSIQWHPATFACSTQHARAIIDADRGYRGRFPADSPLAVGNTFYEVESWTYEPDLMDVPGPLGYLPAITGSADYWAGETVKAAYAGNRRSLAWNLEALRRYVVAAARTVLAYDREAAQRAEDVSAELAADE